MSGLRGYGDLLMLMYRWRGLFHLKLELQHYIERHLPLMIKLANYLGNICVGLKSKSPNTLCYYLLHPGRWWCKWFFSSLTKCTTSRVYCWLITCIVVHTSITRTYLMKPISLYNSHFTKIQTRSCSNLITGNMDGNAKRTLYMRLLLFVMVANLIKGQKHVLY